MSKYLKGFKKEEALNLIRKYMAYRMNSEEILMNLNEKGFSISERTLRRFKQEIKEKSGSTVAEIYKNEIIDKIYTDIFTIEEIEKQSWIEYSKSKSTFERLKALTLIRTTINDKVKLYGNIPLKFRVWKPERPQTNDITDLTKGGKDTLAN